MTEEATRPALTASPAVTREDVEDFLYLEAQLLDEWRLDEWETLLDDDATYLVPSNDCLDGEPSGSLFLISDDRERLHQRLLRIKSPDCHAEFPPSRTCRMISNVRIEGIDDDLVRVAANFICHRFRRYGRVYCFVGHYRYVLRWTPDGLRIKERKVILASEELGTLGSVSFIL
jgi:p-cumate 2,3-dioxygenase beta subunit